MAEDQARPSHDDARSTDEVVESTRMSFGDHLEELRSRVILALLGVVVTTIVALIYGKEILELVCLPLLTAQAASGLPPHLQVLSPTAAFTAYLKIGLLSGIILAMPWILYQVWLFVASGLYKHERRFVSTLIPVSVGLFVTGVLFLYFLVLPLVLQFFIMFNSTFSPPKPSGSFFHGLLLRHQDMPEPVVDLPSSSKVPCVRDEPTNPKPGDIWVDLGTRRLVVQTTKGPWSMALEPGEQQSAMDSQFAIDFYVSFVLLLALGFGIAFETPVVVFFLAWSGIVPAASMARSRRYVLLAAVFLAAVLTPPDVISQLLLAGPMYLLFELGIFSARFVERKQKESQADGTTA